MTLTSLAGGVRIPHQSSGLTQRLFELARNIDRYDTGFGLNGLTLLAVYRHRLSQRAEDLALAQDLCLRAVEGIMNPDRTVPSSLIEISEIAQFLAQHAGELELSETVAPLREVLHQILVKRMTACFDRKEIDPYTGGFQPAWYLLRNGPDARPYLKAWLAALPSVEALEERHEDGSYLLPSGLSHGLAFYALFVCAVVERYPDLRAFQRRGRAYLGVLWRRSVSARRYGCYYLEGKNSGPGRLCLAYGDMGILYAGLRLSLQLGVTDDVNFFTNALRYTAGRRTAETTAITNNSLLYGRSGSWLFFDHLARLTGSSKFSDTAAFWRDEALAHFDDQQEIEGFDHYDYPAMQRVSLFEGPAGPLLVDLALKTNPQALQSIFYLL